MVKDGNLSADSIEALRKRFQDQSRKAQSYYAVMHLAKEVVGSDDAASAWMEQGLAAFDGKSPAELLSAGREAEVLAYINSLTA